jgi:ribose 5-phosphate isomerase B
MQFNSLGIACDHAGKDLKDAVLEFILTLPVRVVDFGTEQSQRVDYPDYVGPLAQAVSTQQLDGGIAICGTGTGMSIVANKFRHVRAANVWDEISCEMSRSHNNANILCLGSRGLAPARVLDLIRLWLKTPFEGGRHQNRLDKIGVIETTNFK